MRFPVTSSITPVVKVRLADSNKTVQLSYGKLGLLLVDGGVIAPPEMPISYSIADAGPGLSHRDVCLRICGPNPGIFHPFLPEVNVCALPATSFVP